MINWNDFQERALDPFSSYRSEEVNKLHKLLCEVNDIWEGLYLNKLDNSRIRVSKGLCLLQGMTIRIIDDIDINIETDDVDGLWDGASNTWIDDNEYWVVIKYQFETVKPANIAEIDIINMGDFDSTSMIKLGTIERSSSTGELIVNNETFDLRACFISKRAWFDSFAPVADQPEVTIVDLQAHSFRVEWEPVDRADNYKVYIYEVGIPTPIYYETSNTYQEVSGLDQLTEYEIRVQGSNSSGNGPLSDTVSVETLVDTLYTPTDFQIDFYDSSEVVLSWTGVSPFDGFKITRVGGPSDPTEFTTSDETFTDDTVEEGTSYNYEVISVYDTLEDDTPAGPLSVTIPLSNTPPETSNIDNIGDRGNIEILFDLIDAESDQCDVFIEASLDDGVTWNPIEHEQCSLMSVDGILSNITPGPDITFTWKTYEGENPLSIDYDGSGPFNPKVKLRMTPDDGTEEGMTSDVYSMIVYNASRIYSNKTAFLGGTNLTLTLKDSNLDGTDNTFQDYDILNLDDNSIDINPNNLSTGRAGMASLSNGYYILSCGGYNDNGSGLDVLDSIEYFNIIEKSIGQTVDSLSINRAGAAGISSSTGHGYVAGGKNSEEDSIMNMVDSITRLSTIQRNVLSHDYASLTQPTSNLMGASSVSYGFFIGGSIDDTGSEQIISNIERLNYNTGALDNSWSSLSTSRKDAGVIYTGNTMSTAEAIIMGGINNLGSILDSIEIIDLDTGGITTGVGSLTNPRHSFAGASNGATGVIAGGLEVDGGNILLDRIENISYSGGSINIFDLSSFFGTNLGNPKRSLNAIHGD